MDTSITIEHDTALVNPKTTESDMWTFGLDFQIEGNLSKYYTSTFGLDFPIEHDTKLRNFFSKRRISVKISASLTLNENQLFILG